MKGSILPKDSNLLYITYCSRTASSITTGSNWTHPRRADKKLLRVKTGEQFGWLLCPPRATRVALLYVTVSVQVCIPEKIHHLSGLTLVAIIGTPSSHCRLDKWPIAIASGFVFLAVDYSMPSVDYFYFSVRKMEKKKKKKKEHYVRSTDNRWSTGYRQRIASRGNLWTLLN